MPGVPSSRGCEGCRRQKKKCQTVNGTTQCTRCQRLSIPCVGLGKQRFKFHSENNHLALQKGQSQSRTSSDRSTSTTSSSNETSSIGTPHYELANALTRLIASFTFNIDETADIRIQLPWNFGTFLTDVPRRLGANEALDAACEVLCAAYANFVGGRVVASAEVVRKHSAALGALRRCLGDPGRAWESETLCSCMILITVQTLLGQGGNQSRSHSVGAAQVLKARGFTGPRDEFESKLLLSLRGPVAIEGIVNGKVQWTSQQWADLVYNSIDNDTPDGQMMRTLAYLPDLMSRGRHALRAPSAPLSELTDLQQEVRDLRDSYGIVLHSLRDRWQHMNLEDFDSPRMKSIIHAHFSRSYGMALCTGIILNCITTALVGDPDNSIRLESSLLADESLALADVAEQYRPLGAIYMVVCLIAAWVGATEEGKREVMRLRLADYQRDVQGEGAETSVLGLEWMERRFYLRDWVDWFGL